MAGQKKENLQLAFEELVLLGTKKRHLNSCMIRQVEGVKTSTPQQTQKASSQLPAFEPCQQSQKRARMVCSQKRSGGSSPLRWPTCQEPCRQARACWPMSLLNLCCNQLEASHHQHRRQHVTGPCAACGATCKSLCGAVMHTLLHHSIAAVAVELFVR